VPGHKWELRHATFRGWDFQCAERTRGHGAGQPEPQNPKSQPPKSIPGPGLGFLGSEFVASVAHVDSPENEHVHLARLQGSYLRLIDSCITQLEAQGPSRTCNESQEEEEAGFAVQGFEVLSQPP